MKERRVNTESSYIERAFARLILIQRNLCEFVIVLMVLFITAEVISRGFLNQSLHITHEIAGYLLVTVAFLSIGVSLHDRAMFRVEFFFMYLPHRGQCALQLLFDLLALGFGVILDHQLIRLVVSSYSHGVKEATILATPLYLPQIVMPVGVSLMIVVLLMQILRGVHELVRPEAARYLREIPR